MKLMEVLTLMVTLGEFSLAFGNYSESFANSPPFDAAQYKEYLTNLKCTEIKNNHQGMKIPEVGGIVYQPSPSHPSQSPTLPPLPTPPPLFPNAPPPLLPNERPLASASPPAVTEDTTSYPTLVPTNQQTKSSQNDSGILPASEYDQNVKNFRKGQNQDLPDRNTSQAGILSEVTPLPQIVDELTEQVSGINIPANTTQECTSPLTKEWANYNWYQVLLDNGGPPGAYLQKGFKSGLIKVADPCARPANPVPTLPTLQEKTISEFTHSEFEKVYRTEHAQVMLPETPHEFLDVTGQLVWSPPNFTRRYFHMTYRKDDTGLYFRLNKQICVFTKDTYDVRVACENTPLTCDCFHGKEMCISRPVPFGGLSPRVVALLVG